MNFRLPAFALLTVLLALPHAYGQMSGASYVETIDQAPTTLTLNSSSSVVALETPPLLSAVVSYPKSGQTAGNVTFTVENGSTVVATNTAPVDLTGVATWSPSLPTGTFTIFAVYSGDSNLLGSTSPAISQTVLGPPDFSFSVSPFSVAQGQTGSCANHGHGDQWLPRHDHIQLCLTVLRDGLRFDADLSHGTGSRVPGIHFRSRRWRRAERDDLRDHRGKGGTAWCVPVELSVFQARANSSHCWAR